MILYVPLARLPALTDPDIAVSVTETDVTLAFAHEEIDDHGNLDPAGRVEIQIAGERVGASAQFDLERPKYSVAIGGLARTDESLGIELADYYRQEVAMVLKALNELLGPVIL